MGRSADETERLIEQAQLYEGVTLRMLRNAADQARLRTRVVASKPGSLNASVSYAAAFKGDPQRGTPPGLETST